MAVLIVEDQRNLALRYMGGFGRNGISAVHARDMKTAMRLAEENSINVALVDMGIAIDSESDDMRETSETPYNGLNLLIWLKARGVPVFALTGTHDQDILRKINCPLIEKPVEDFDEEVLAVVMPYLGNSLSRKE